ncbi:MAG: hypothetical protein QMC33_04280 [Octadecabacter sp.]
MRLRTLRRSIREPIIRSASEQAHFARTPNFQGCSKNARFWHMPALPRFMLPQTPFKTDVVFEGL